MPGLPWKTAHEEIKILKVSGTLEWIYRVQPEDLLDKVPGDIHIIYRIHKEYTNEIGTNMTIKLSRGSLQARAESKGGCYRA